MRGRNGWLTQEGGGGEGERVTDSNEAATSSGGTCGLSVRYCGTRCGTEPSSSYCRFPVINVPRRASNPCTARSSPRHLSLSLSLSFSVPYPPTEYRIARDNVQPCWILWIGMKSICIEGTGMKLLSQGPWE